MALPPPDPFGTCVVTGASSGIGAEIARALAARGLGVTLVARRRDRLEALAAELAEAHGVRVEALTADLTDADSREGLIAEVGRLGLVVDVLVNNAGFSTSGPVRLASRRQELAQVRTDVEAVVDLCTLVVPAMTERRRGAVCNVASTAAFQPLPGQAGYSAAKGYVLTYSEALAAEVRRFGVSVTALCPGPVETEFFDTAGISEQERRGLPRFMWVSPHDVAAAAVDGMASGREVVIPGAANRVSAVVARHTPHRVLVPALGRFYPLVRGG